MVGKAFAWKAVTASALTAELGKPFQRGMTSGKKENLYALVRGKICRPAGIEIRVLFQYTGIYINLKLKVIPQYCIAHPYWA